MDYKETVRGCLGLRRISVSTNFTMEQFWVWAKSDGVDYYGYEVTGAYHCIEFDN